VQILVKKGSATAFQGITDGAGKFFTPPLEPGIYQFEVRAPRIVGATRYFLALAGARPLGGALTNAFGELAMQAEVRKPVSVRGQVRAFRVMRPPASADTETTNGSSTSVPSPWSASNIPAPVMVNRSAAPFSGNATSARSAAPPNANAVAPAPRTAASSQSPLGSAPGTSVSVARSAVPEPRIIGGKRYVWVPVASGSGVGRWVLDPGYRASPAAAPTKPSPAPRTSPSGR
jgi:hypothetical protein